VTAVAVAQRSSSVVAEVGDGSEAEEEIELVVAVGLVSVVVQGNVHSAMIQETWKVERCEKKVPLESQPVADPALKAAHKDRAQPQGLLMGS
jgi:hypothetical protein